MRKLLKSWYLWSAVGLIAIIIGAGLDYRAYSVNKFNALVTSLQAQELAGTKKYITMSTLASNIGNGGVTQSADSAQLAILQKEADQMKQVASGACGRQATDLTSANLDNSVKRAWLSSSQKQYISDSKNVLKILDSSADSSKGMCSAGTLLAAEAENFVQLLPGTIIVTHIQNDPEMPSSQEIDSLKKYTTASAIDRQILQKGDSAGAAYFSAENNLFANVYYYWKATEDGNTAAITTYGNKLNQLSVAFGPIQKKSEDAGKAIDAKLFDAAITASKAQIKLIDAQQSLPGTAAKLDYAVPVFWMLDGKIQLKADESKNQTNPHATSVAQLVSVMHDSDLTKLAKQNLLKNASYTSLGSDNSGMTLQVTLLDGTLLTEHEAPRNS